MDVHRRLAVLAAAAFAVAAAPAAAHVQVRPAVVAPDDPVLWTVLVPGERDVEFTKVTLQVPPDVVPFSFEDAPGWKRTLQTAGNGALETVTWTGRAAPDGLATFRFLAATPAEPGTITWKALQTYADGQVARWIGAPDSDSPASVTTVDASAPRENAGGESAGATPATPARPAVAAPAASERDGLTLGIAIGAGVAALLALAVALLTRPRRSG